MLARGIRQTKTVSSFSNSLFCLTDLSSAMFAWVLLANLQANLTQFRCIPHYVTRRDVTHNCSLEEVVYYRHFPRVTLCGYARVSLRQATCDGIVAVSCGTL